METVPSLWASLSERRRSPEAVGQMLRQHPLTTVVNTIIAFTILKLISSPNKEHPHFLTISQHILGVGGWGGNLSIVIIIGVICVSAILQSVLLFLVKEYYAITIIILFLIVKITVIIAGVAAVLAIAQPREPNTLN